MHNQSEGGKAELTDKHAQFPFTCSVVLSQPV